MASAEPLTRAKAIGDAELVARCRRGDDLAWNELVERFSRYVYAICVQGFRLAPHDAEDAFQDVFAKTYVELDRLRDPAALRPWIAQLTRRTCLDRLRAGARETVEEVVEPAGVDDALDVLDEALTVRQAMEGIGEMCQEMLDRFFASDESYRTIGEALDLPSGTIASRISRCLDKLKTAMEDPEPLPRPVDG
jgi:RNA polymerase sigma factor (sigma-70 family)